MEADNPLQVVDERRRKKNCYAQQYSGNGNRNICPIRTESSTIVNKSYTENMLEVPTSS